MPPTVLAALDNSLAGNPVLVTARALARILGASVGAIHVVTDDDPAPQDVARAAGVPLRIAHGSVDERLVEAASDDDVAIMVIGARATPSGRRPLGTTAFAVATSVSKPVVVVPPDGRIAPDLRRVLVPLEGTMSSSLAPRSVVELARSAGLDVVVLHVDDEDEIPAFTDRPQEKDDAWAREFLERYCPWGIGAVRLEQRIGRREELVPLVADQLQCDLIALGWAQELSEGRAPIVRATLDRSQVPVMLVPVRQAEHAWERADAVSAEGGRT